jgi:hypothetical protein
MSGDPLPIGCVAMVPPRLTSSLELQALASEPHGAVAGEASLMVEVACAALAALADPLSDPRPLPAITAATAGAPLS